MQERSGQDPRLALAVAISGGGHRAANYGIGVLAALESIQYESGNALGEVDYLSTVSGGSFAAGFVIGKAAARSRIAAAGADTTSLTTSFFDACRTTSTRAAAEPRCLRPILRRDFESVLWTRMTSPRILFTKLTSGDALEKALDDDILGARGGQTPSLSLRDVFIYAERPDKPKLPYWVANATVFENGAIFPFAPNVIEAYGVSRYNHRMSLGQALHPDSTDRLPLSVGLKASASFPVLIPSTVLTVHPPRDSGAASDEAYLRLLDGGMGDNLGVMSALRLLKQDTVASRKVLLVIDAYPGTGDPFTSRDRSERPLSVLRHLGDISLESWHGKRKEIISAIADGEKIGVIYLGFEDLVAMLLRRRLSEPSMNRERACAKVDHLQPSSVTEEDPGELQKAARAVGTRLKISASQQTTLLNAGRMVVRLHCDSIVRAIAGAS